MTSAGSRQRSTRPERTAGGWMKDHGLLLANIVLFVLFFGGMVISGSAEYSEDQLVHYETGACETGACETGVCETGA